MVVAHLVADVTQNTAAPRNLVVSVTCWSWSCPVAIARRRFFELQRGVVSVVVVHLVADVTQDAAAAAAAAAAPRSLAVCAPCWGRWPTVSLARHPPLSVRVRTRDTLGERLPVARASSADISSRTLTDVTGDVVGTVGTGYSGVGGV